MVTIVDSSGHSISSSQSVVVTPVVSAMQNVPSGSITVTGTSLQPAVPTFLDQFGNVMAASRPDLVHL